MKCFVSATRQCLCICTTRLKHGVVKLGWENQRTVGDEAAKVAADDAVPGRAFSLVELCVVSVGKR